MKEPKISIITVSFNAENEIERTINSVLFQTYKNIEYIVIDGASKDKTTDIIRKYEDHIDFWMSEPDKSHFDAMNKGLHKCTGDYVLYMNAGDRLREENSLKNLMSLKENADFYYSRAEYINEEGERWPWHKNTPLPNKLRKKSFINGMVICHHCMVVKRSIVPEYNLDPWKVSNDLDWAIRIMENVKNVCFLDDIFCLYLSGGISNKYKWKAVKERFNITLKHFGLIPVLLEQVKIIFQLIFRKKDEFKKS